MTIHELAKKYYNKGVEETGEYIYLIVVPYCWGRGFSIEGAKRQVKRMGYSGRFPKKHTTILRFPKETKPYLDDMGRLFCGGATYTIVQEPKVPMLR